LQWSTVADDALNLGGANGVTYDYSTSDWFDGMGTAISEAQDASPGLSVIKGENIYISAEYLNICGTIQSGMPDQTVTIGSSDAAAIQALNAAYQSGTTLSSTQLTNLGLKNDNNGLYQLTTASGDTIDAYYDPATQQIQLAQVSVQGGHMELYGQICSTGDGQINVLDGYGQVSITNNTNYTLVTNLIDTGDAAGYLKITDTSFTQNGEPLVTEYYRQDGATYTDSYYEPATIGGAITYVTSPTDLGTSKTTDYQPALGQRYYWTTAMATETQTTDVYSTSDWLGVSAFNLGSSNQISGPVTTNLYSTPLIDGSYIGQSTDASAYSYSPTTVSSSNWVSLSSSNGGTPISLGSMTGNGGSFEDSSGNVYSVSDVANTMLELGVTNAPATGALLTYTGTSANGISGLTNGATYYVAPNEQLSNWTTSTWYGKKTYYEKTVTENFQTTYTLNSIDASLPVNIDFIGDNSGSGNVSIVSGGSVIVDGNIQNAGGTTTIEAGYNGTTTPNAGASISTAGNVTIEGQSIDLQASTGIGASGAIKTSLVSGADGSITAQSTTGNIQINETTGNLNVGQITTADSSSASGDVTLTTVSGAITAASAQSIVSGGAVTLTATDGSIGNLGTNGTANAPGSGAQALNIETASSMQDDFNATATGDIYVSQASGDLYVDSITSTGGDVRVELGSGTMVDANTDIQQNPLTWDQLLNVYTQMNATS
ncbi:MAG: hypothetical protein WAK26_05360, partial [Terracidiphilus sp.]